MQLRPLGDGGLAAEIAGIDFAAPPATEVAADLRRAFAEHPVLCLRTDGLTPAGYLAVARLFGEPKLQLLRSARHPDHDEISYIASRLRDELGDGRRVVPGAEWHTDDSYLQRPCWATMLYANIIPESGGDTEFADMYRACAALPAALRQRIEGRRAAHTYLSRRNINFVPKRSAEEEAESPPASHPLICRHPDTGREALYLNPNRIERIEGMPDEQGDPLLDELFAFAVRPEFLYRHEWRPHDIVIWDNRCTMHKATDDYGGQKREMLRVLIDGPPPR
ncbi:MAG: TauD/TfdA family dioxygenase [Alphaproteobacteria bacterium]|nr:TauD/TfdA family dioxygenase [Alphaproteobacteria bacterium]